MSSFPHSQHGFTLIELMVAITIMALLSSFGIVSFVTYSRSQSLKAATQDFITVLQSAKASATSQIKPDTCANTGVLDGYEVIRNSQSSYSIGPVCGGTYDSASSKTVTLPTNGNVSFDDGSSLTILFQTVTGIVSFDPPQSNNYADVVLRESQSNATQTVRVYSDGRINVL